jgi:hypothetical protein
VAFDWSHQTAYRFIRAFEAFGRTDVTTLLHTPSDVSGLCLLGAPSTPAEIGQRIDLQRNLHGAGAKANGPRGLQYAGGRCKNERCRGQSCYELHENHSLFGYVGLKPGSSITVPAEVRALARLFAEGQKHLVAVVTALLAAPLAAQAQGIPGRFGHLTHDDHLTLKPVLARVT